MPDYARFWNRMARGYAKSPIKDKAAYQTKLDKTREFLTPQSRVLEFGCGTGSTALVHAPYVQHIRAIDFSREMIAIAMEKQAAQGVENVDFEVADFSDLVVDDQFDVVMGMSVLHLLPNWHDTIDKAFAMLKPGGVFVSSTVVLGSGYWFLRLALPLAKPFGLLPQVQFFSPEELMQRLRQAGFEIVHDWRPNPRAALFVIARKPET